MNCGRYDRKPTWWLLYAIAVLLVGLVGLLETSVPDGAARGVLELLAVVTTFWLMAKWLRHNREAIDLEQGRRR